MFELGDFVFYSELLALQIGDVIDIRQGTAEFAIDFFIQAAVTGPEGSRYDPAATWLLLFLNKTRAADAMMLPPIGAPHKQGYAARAERTSSISLVDG